MQKYRIPYLNVEILNTVPYTVEILNTVPYCRSNDRLLLVTKAGSRNLLDALPQDSQPRLSLSETCMLYLFKNILLLIISVQYPQLTSPPPPPPPIFTLGSNLTRTLKKPARARNDYAMVKPGAHETILVGRFLSADQIVTCAASIFTRFQSAE